MHRTIPTHAGSSNRHRHRVNLAALAKMREQDRRAALSTLVDKMVTAFNSHEIEAAGVSPYEAMFGRAPRDAARNALAEPVGEQGALQNITVEQAIAAASASEEAVGAIQVNAVIANEYRSSRQRDSRGRQRSFAVGNEVLYQGTTDAKEKIGAGMMFAGPFLVSKVWDDGHSLELAYANGQVAERKVAARRCAPYVDHVAELVKVAGPVDEQRDIFPNGALEDENKVNVRLVQRRQWHAHERSANE